MKIFIDSGDVQAIKKAAETGMVDGVTTNPSLVSKSGRPFEDVVKDICEAIPGPVSAEVMSETAEEMIEEAQRIAAIAPNVVVKIPMNTEGMKVVPVLEKQKKVKVNVTMVFSPTQAYLAMKAGATYVSIVLSRMDAVAIESDTLVKDTALIRNNYGYKSEIIAGSMKTQNHVLSCLRAGVDVVTIPDALLFQMFKHPLTDAGLAGFKKDWQKVPKAGSLV